MHVDHLTFAAGPDGLHAAVARLEDQLGAKFRDGGFHPRFGTRNNILPLTHDRYIEVVEVLEHPAAMKEPFGQAVRARTEMGGGWLGWVVSVTDLTPYETRLEREAYLGSRRFPDGRLLEWQQIGVTGLINDPQLPFFIKWTSEEEVLPRALDGDIDLVGVEIAGSRSRVSNWLGAEVGDSLDDVDFVFTAPNGNPGLDAATFATSKGLVRI
ncbi:MAG: VOC family protein [Propionibacteriaceae bacterium]|nr:VOC family protein [Micropruina sp.]HBX81647.1 glycosyltransferase [Propionibacteriaceae bacterium]HBY24255.1 glycosyltransferase [Propionibacteriaceae bacterium]